LFQQPVVLPPAPRHGNRLVVVVDETVGGDITVGIVGTGVTVLTVGATVIVGTVAAELTPRLPISNDPNGSPVRAAPPGVVGDVDAGVDDAAMLLEPEPHIPDNPEVSRIPEVVDVPGDDISDVTTAPGVVVPIAIPPPS
jgi:hypothetical protein